MAPIMTWRFNTLAAMATATGGNMAPNPRGMINYFLYFPSEEAARHAAERLMADGYGAGVRDYRDADASNPWLTYVTAPLPESDDVDLDEVEEYMETLAAEEGGEYDGYERDVRR